MCAFVLICACVLMCAFVLMCTCVLMCALAYVRVPTCVYVCLRACVGAWDLCVCKNVCVCGDMSLHIRAFIRFRQCVRGDALLRAHVRVRVYM